MYRGQGICRVSILQNCEWITSCDRWQPLVPLVVISVSSCVCIEWKKTWKNWSLDDSWWFCYNKGKKERKVWAKVLSCMFFHQKWLRTYLLTYWTKISSWATGSFPPRCTRQPRRTHLGPAFLESRTTTHAWQWYRLLWTAEHLSLWDLASTLVRDSKSQRDSHWGHLFPKICSAKR